MISKLEIKVITSQESTFILKSNGIALAVKSATKEARDITSGMCDNASLHVVSDKKPQWLILNVLAVAGVTTSQQNVITDKTCNKCKKKGHIDRVCLSRLHTSVATTDQKTYCK